LAAVNVHGGQGSSASSRVWRRHGEQAHVQAAQQGLRENAEPAERAPQLIMLGGKVGYYADFVVYGTLLLALVTLTLPGSRSDQLIWITAAVAGLVTWTLVEYLLHRFMLHRMPLIAHLHHAHHAAPRAYLGTPTWASLPVLAGVFFIPAWRLLSLEVAFGAFSGIIAGWLWYGIVHHVIHHRRPRRLAVALRVASHRHLLHHSPYLSGNFGVTTAVWDRLFGTHISPRARAVSVAVHAPQ
jgi:sterol desaturase/sphingolipid hydroxylase (fatty acid hydroxylase superfamily)